MSKLNNNILKSKIESIAKMVTKKKEETNNFLTTIKNKEESKENKLNLSINTLKDSLSCLEDFKNTYYNDNLNIKKFDTNYLKKNSKNNFYKCKNNSSICTKGTLSSDNRNSINDSYQNEKKEQKYQKDKMEINNNKSLINNKKSEIQKEKNQILLNNIIEDDTKNINILLKKINTEQINELNKINEQLIFLFNNIKKYENNKEYYNNEYIIKSTILSLHYIKILLSQNIEYITKLFYKSIEINKFFLYQIYLFLNIIYLNEEKINEYFILSYKTILLYSFQNFENISKILLNFTLFNDEKINKNILILNKIIVSILKTITDIPSNSQIMYYITPIKYNNGGDNIENRKSGINNLLILLKENKKLNEKLLDIEMKEIKLEEKNNLDNYEIEENLININKKNDENEKILSEIDINKYKYYVLIELDETLVHYCEEDDNYFVKVRLGSEDFLEYIHTFCEITIVSTSEIEYSEIIINNLDKNKNIINNRIYSNNYKDLDLSKINRNMSKTFFICHEYNFLGAPKSNIIKLKEFDGDEKDKEFVKLQQEFKKIENSEIDDIRNIINKMQNDILDDKMV